MRYLAIVTVIAVGLLAIGFVLTQSTPAEQLSYPGKLEQGDMTFEESGEFYDLYQINFKEGQFVDMYLASETFDTYLYIVMPSGEEISIDEYFEGDPNAAIQFVSRETGMHDVYVTSSKTGETGDYDFTCDIYDTKLEQSYQGELDEGDEVSWKGGEYYDRYEMQLKPFERRTLSIDSDEFAAYLSVHEPDGHNDYVYGKPAALMIEADENGGAYTLIVTSSTAKEVGAYNLEIRSFVEDDAEARAAAEAE